MTTPRTLSIAELAKALGVHPSTARQFIREGRITHVHVGNRVRVGEQQLADYLAGERSTQLCDECRPAAAPLQAVAS